MKKIKEIINRVGLINTLIAIFKRLLFALLRVIFGFNRWHASAVINSRPYKLQTVAIVNELKPESVVEIGCGLGEILKRIEAKNKIGIDSDPGVLKAARLIDRTGSKYIESDFFNVKKVHIPFESTDILLMINWSHELLWEKLKNTIIKLQEELKIKTLVIDIIVDSDVWEEDYSVFTIENLSEIGTATGIIDAEDKSRKICTVNLNV